MRLDYMGADITDRVTVGACTLFDRLGEKWDSAEICFENKKEWLHWRPKISDALIIGKEGYTSSDLFVDEIAPKKRGFYIYAGSLPPEAREAKWEGYENVTLFELLRKAAEEMGMDAAIYGDDGGQAYGRLWRRNESWPAFLYRMAALENMYLKCAGKSLVLCERNFIYESAPVRIYEIDEDAGNWQYTEMYGALAAVAVVTPLGGGEARIGKTGIQKTVCGLPAGSSAEAGRWAKGLLISHNEKRECFTLETVLDTGLAAGCRIDLAGLPLVEGKWVCVETAHDIKNGLTKVVLNRCIEDSL